MNTMELSAPVSPSRMGIVVIGRNEGERLRRCFKSLTGRREIVVYVDSGSSDNSVASARSAGIAVVELDPAIPFTAARARNAGFARLQELQPSVEFVQFIDGDCEIAQEWMDRASEFLEVRKDVAVAYGRRRERYPTRSIYNLLCDIEWDTPVGEARGCGGDALIRVQAFKQVSGYNGSVIAAEDTELCVRLRKMGWRIWRLDTEMTTHDAAMIRFDQWWRRSVRAGYCFALGTYLHGSKPERLFVWETRRTWLWALLLPIVCFAFGYLIAPYGFLVFLIYPLQILRLAARNSGSAFWRVKLGALQVLARFPEWCGQLIFVFDQVHKRSTHIIEYK